MRLSNANVHIPLKVAYIDETCSEEVINSFFALGLFPGVRIRVLHKRKFLMQVRLGSTLCSIRNSDAIFIEVTADDIIG